MSGYNISWGDAYRRILIDEDQFDLQEAISDTNIYIEDSKNKIGFISFEK